MASDVAPQLVLGIDPGLTNTGVVLMEKVSYCTYATALIQAEPSAAKRLWDIERALDSIVVEYMMDHQIIVFIEGYAFGAKYQRESLAELGGVLRRYFYVNGLTYWVIDPLTAKKYVTGTSSANKNYMKKVTKERWGVDFKSDHICDAYGLARLGVDVLTYPHLEHLKNMTDTQIEVVTEIAENPLRYKGANTARRSRKT